MFKKDLFEKNTKEGLFILTCDGKYIFSLNETGAFIWNALKRNKARDEIIKDLTSIYDVEKSHAIKDVDIFIKEVKKHSAELINR